MPFLIRSQRYAVVCAVVICAVSACLSVASLCFLVPVGSLLAATPAQSASAGAPAGPNSDPSYQALRNLTLSGEAFTVKNLELKRDAGTFHLRSGTVCFVAPVQGKVTGAVFVGDGNFILDPPTDVERKSLKLLTKEDAFSENFERAVLRFTDSTYDDIKKASAAASGCDGGPLKDSQHVTRHRLKYNLESRILEDVLSPEPGGLFVAFIHGKRYNGEELYTIDPREGRDQVDFQTYDDNKFGDWASFPASGAHARGTVGHTTRIEHEQLDTTLEKSANLIGKATTSFTAHANGVRVVPFNLFRTLRVRSVTGEDGQALSFIQEDKNDDAEFAVILPRVLAAGDHCAVTITYEGKEAVTNEGGGNYYTVPAARMNWYPNDRGGGLGEYVTYDMTFRIPKGMQIAATGVRLSESNDGGQNVTVWKSEAPQTVAGFSFGKFKMEDAKLDKPEYFLQSYANDEPPDWVKALKSRAEGDTPTSNLGMLRGREGGEEVALGSMSTTGLNKKALAEGALAVQFYTDYFGPSSFKHLQLTQQTACNFGQSWPELVWIPICYYFDATVRHQLGMDWGDRGYWKVVTPHEVAHQWWGHTVGFSSYRDQWMSEGFADMSASLYLSLIEKNPKKFIAFWNDERDLLLERDAQGFRAIDAGPLTMGYRTSNSRTGFDTTSRLIYPKGAYVLHMIRMMMHDNRGGDQLFKETMQDFVKTYTNKAATTEDFKATVEKHMTPEMDLEGNHKLDWFFNEYVYGTQLPSYKQDSSFDVGADGEVVLDLKVTQSNVDDKFRMLVPVYLEMADGNMFFLGRARIAGNNSLEQKIPLKGLKTKPRRVVLSYYDDVLASPS
ncbi:MAG TPA: M1 family aminopeptidase [Candidatus Sulfotelmatobacter sp.]|nr:M1 family aminopeptidase [Candidatus Sulfotelmatobacter sp.]